MLQQIRDRTSGLVAGFIVALIAIPFAFFGIESFTSGGGDPVVAKVGDQKIRDSQFRNAYDQRYQQLQALMGENFRSDLFDQTRFREAVLKDMTQESMLRQYSEKQGYQANDALLFQTISGIPAFQVDGRFDSEAYKTALARQGLDPHRFEQQLRDSIEMDQLRATVVESAFVVPTQAEQDYRLTNQERALSYVLFDTATYLPQISVSDEELQARYERDKAQFMAPERIKLAYVELSMESLAAAAAPADDVLKVLYDAEKASRFTTQEERKASHIMVSFGSDKSEAKKKIEQLAAQLKGGQDFATLAKSSSEDPGSKDQGGDLGWVRRGQMTEKFEQALFALKSGVVSDPVETEFGWHLIRADEVKPGLTRSLDEPEVREELIALYRNREQQKQFQEKLEKLEQLAFENPTSLAPVAEALELPLQTTEWFTRAGGAGLAANEAIRTAAFSTEILGDGENSKPITIGDDKIVVLRKAEHEAPRQRSLAEVSVELRDALRNEAALAKAKADAAEVLAAVRGGKALSAVAADKGLALKSPGLVRRDNGNEDRVVLEALFKLPRPAAGATTYGETVLPAGGVAVLALSEVQEPTASGATAEAQRARLRELVAGGEFGGYRDLIESKIKLEIVNAPGSEAPVDPSL